TLYKIDANGNLIFSKQIGGADWDFIYDIKQLDENKLVMCGNTFSNASSLGNAYLLCIDTLGNVLWEKQFNNENYETYLKSLCIYNDSIYSVGKVKNGNIEKYIIYKFSSEGIEIAKHIDLSIDGVSEFNYCEFKINGNEILCIGNKRLIQTDSSINPQTLLISFSNELVPQQLELSGGVGDENGRYFTQLPNGEIVLVGLTNSFGSGGKGMLIYRFSEAIVYYNGASFGDIGDEEVFSVCTNKNNRILFCGKSNSYNVNGEDCYWVSMESPFIVSEYTLNISKQVDVLSPVSLENVDKIEMLQFQIINNKIVVNLDKKFDFSVYNIEAKLLYTGDNFNNDISFLNSGIYFIKIRTTEISKAQKYFKMN
ncbi:MAG: T9SS type A sorting domain-containing protein, partial [Bacteroidota bacterium]